MKLPKTILITGAAGFVGNNLAAYIKNEYPQIKLLLTDKLRKRNSEIKAIDINKSSSLKAFLNTYKPQIIFHMAGKAWGDNIRELFQANIIGTINLFEAIKAINDYSPRIVIPSSAAEYGMINNKSSSHITEDMPTNPVNLYGISKKIQTDLAMFYARSGYDVVVCRIFNISGPGTPKTLVIGKVAGELAEIKLYGRSPLIRTKSQNTHRDFLDIRDVTRCLFELALKGKSREIYNICSGNSYKISDVIQKLLRISGIKNINIKADKNGKRAEIRTSVGSNKKLKIILGIQNFIPLEISLKDTFELLVKGK